MNKRIKIIILIIAIIIFIAIIRLIILKINLENKSNKEEWNNEFYEANKNEVNYKDSVTVNELKEEMGIKADSDLYEVSKEYDGRKTLNIKPNILYKVAFAGIVKKSKPVFEEIDEIFNNEYPKKNGIWISEQAREHFLKLVNESTNTNTAYIIDEEGYLKVKEKNEKINEFDKKLENTINSNNTIIVDINSFDYDVDTVTGEIVEYPFEQLGDYIDIINNDNNDKIIVIIANKSKKYSSNDIFKEFIDNI